MSYDICYDRCFIKSGLGITPMWLVGSSNCTETVYGTDGKFHERKERHWSSLFNFAGVSEEELMEKARSYVPSNYNTHFMRGGKWVDDAGWIRFVENGIKKAVTIEQLLKHTHRTAMKCSLQSYEELTFKYALEEWVKTTAEFDDWIVRAKKFKEESAEKYGPWFSIDMGLREPIRIVVPRDDIAGKVAAKYKGNYIVGVDVDRISYSKRVEDAIVWNSLEEAKAAIEKHNFPVTYIDGDSVLERKNWKWRIIVTSANHYGKYIKKRSARHMWFASIPAYAMKFPSKHAAEKYIAKLANYNLEFKAVEV